MITDIKISHQFCERSVNSYQNLEATIQSLCASMTHSKDLAVTVIRDVIKRKIIIEDDIAYVLYLMDVFSETFANVEVVMFDLNISNYSSIVIN
jgi:ATP-dependent exoDNAse (exonuclease V) beta subunit